MAPQARLFPPLSMKEVLEGLGSFDENEFKILLDATTTPAAFDSSKERCESIGRKTNRDPALFGYLFAVLDFLYKEVQRKGRDEQTLRSLINELLASLEVGKGHDGHIDVKALSERLLRLLSYNENAERRDKIGRLKRGFLRNAVGFSTFVDLRPNINQQRSKIDEFVPLVQFRVSTDSDDEEERSWVFQLDEHALDKLKQAIDDVQKKLELIKNDGAVSERIVR